MEKITMITAKNYKIDEWYGFYDKIDEAIDDFYEEKKKYPNYIAFSDHTYNQICFLFSYSPLREYIVDDDVDEKEITIDKFLYDDCELECLIGEDLHDKEFELLFDNETDYGDDDDDGDDDYKSPFDLVPSDGLCYA